ncbi:MAG: patatin-like phospholipase family protein, partial [Oligoflexia bacterium]|nr:patatin-like phospholipase family protein [Oligoflexia bacterium]
YQAGVLKYIGENFPQAHFSILTGSSSGAINVAGLASLKGELSIAGPKIAELWSSLETQQVFRTDIASLSKIGSKWLYDLMLGGVRGKPKGNSLLDTSPLKKLLDQIFDKDAIQEALDEKYLKHVAVSATEVNTGSLVTFVQSNDVKLWTRARRRSIATDMKVDHIMASAAIPLLFPSVLINKRQYVDGCIRSTSPLGVATRLGALKIMAIGVRRHYSQRVIEEPSRNEPVPTPAELAALIMNSMFAEALDSDVEHLERLNSFLPDKQQGSFSLKKIELLAIRPSEDVGKLANKFEKEAPTLIRFLLRGIGSEKGDSSDILSYLLFEPKFLSALVELGYKDAKEKHEEIEKFFSE